MKRATLNPDEVRFLSSFQVGLAAIERDLELAKLIGYYDRPDDVRHPALAFAFRHAPIAVITVNVLLLAELLEVHLEHASTTLLGRSLWTGSGRARHLADPDLRRLKELRDATAAHSVKLRSRGADAVKGARQASGTVIASLQAAVGKIRTLMDQLVHAGLFRSFRRPPVRLTTANTFTTDDLRQLIAAANAILEASG